MRDAEIQVGAVYCNNGAGRTTRKVIAIGPEHAPKHWAGKLEKRPKDGTPGVLYEQDGSRARLYLPMFAAWAGRKLR